jgi:hypothetical protein
MPAARMAEIDASNGALVARPTWPLSALMEYLQVQGEPAETAIVGAIWSQSPSSKSNSGAGPRIVRS